MYWNSPDQWGEIIHDWAMDKFGDKAIFTVFELLEGDDTANEPFHGLEKGLFIKAIKSLQAKNKAELFDNDEGVKFFSH